MTVIRDDHLAMETDLAIEDDVYVKQIVVRNRGSAVPQHAHKYDHVTCVAYGAVKVWADGVYLGEFAAPKLITIRAGVKHGFLTSVDNTVLLCIHNAARPDVAAVVAEHRIGA